MERAVDLQARGYRLLGWLERSMASGAIQPHRTHEFATLDASARAFIEKSYPVLPEDVRPAKEDLRAFANLFATYLESTFDLDTQPGQRLYSPDAHCFCPHCSWMVQIPYFTPKKLTAADKLDARRMELRRLHAMAAEMGVSITEAQVDVIANEPSLRADRALVAYGKDLLDRLEGIAVGPASLALWRGFAWTPQGSPKKGFKLTATAILEAQDVLAQRIRAIGR